MELLGDEPPQLGDPAPDDAADRCSPSSCRAWAPLLRTSSEPHCRHTLLVVTDLPPPDELHAASPLSYSSLLRTACDGAPPTLFVYGGTAHAEPEAYVAHG